MTRDEVKELVMVMYAYYPIHEPKTVEKKTATVNAWFLALSDFNKQDVTNALVAFVRTDRNGFPPSVGQIIGLMNFNSSISELTAIQAWSEVRKKLSKCSYYSKEVFESLSEEIKQAVGSAERLKEMAQDSSFNEGVESSNFIRAYNKVLERKHMIDSLPAELKPQLPQVPQYQLETRQEFGFEREEVNNRIDIEELVNVLKEKLGG